MRSILLLTVLVGLVTVGCFRARYVNFRPPGPGQTATRSVDPVRVSGWESFFIYGWAPGERRIDARMKCGGADNIDSIETRRTFAQGLVAAIAGYYINIYSPWDGAVLCKEQPPIP